MEQVNLWLALVGALVLFLGLGTGLLRSRGYLPSEPILAVAFGVAAGPQGFDVLRLAPVGEPQVILEEVARLTVALAVARIALRLSPRYFRDRAVALATLRGERCAIRATSRGSGTPRRTPRRFRGGTPLRRSFRN